MFESIAVSADGVRGTLELDRPGKLNALSPLLLREIAAAARWFDEERPDVRVVVVSGRGRAFSAGADVTAFTSALTSSGPPSPPAPGPTRSPSGAAPRAERGVEGPTDPHTAADAGRLMAEALERMQAITIARIQGWCIGGGLVLAAACDLRIATEDTRFAIPEVDLGIPLAWGGIPRLVREIGPAATKELVITCREFAADEALRLGLLNQVVPADELDDAVEHLAATVAAKPRLAVRSTKRHVNAVTETMSQAASSWADADGLLAALNDPEGQASAQAYLQRVTSQR